MQENIQKLNNNSLEVMINVLTGQIVSVKYKNKEYFHGGGKPKNMKNEHDLIPGTWPNSMLYMFPIIGKNSEGMSDADKYSLGSHGISRAITWIDSGLNRSEEQILLMQQYGGSNISNPRFKQGKGPENLNFLPYNLEQGIFVKDNSISLRQNIQNKSKEKMYYKFGAHPSFIFDPNNINKSYFLVGKNRQKLGLKEMINQSQGKAHMFNNSVEKIMFIDEIAEKTISLETENFGYMMLWTPGLKTEVICMEPTTSLEDYKVLEPEEIAIYNFIMKFS